MVTNVVTNALMFVVLLFSPIVYPVSQLPRWLATVHYFLPFYNMAVVIRAGLTSGVAAHVATSFVVRGGVDRRRWRGDCMGRRPPPLEILPLRHPDGRRQSGLLADTGSIQAGESTVANLELWHSRASKTPRAQSSAGQRPTRNGRYGA